MNMKTLNTKYQDCHWYKICSSYASIFMDEIETISLILKSLSFWYGFDISILFSLFGHMVKKNWKALKKISITTTPTLNLPMSSIKKVFPFWTLK